MKTKEDITGLSIRCRGALTKAVMREHIAKELREPPESLPDDQDLINRGLESLAVLRLLSLWAGLGVNLKFSDLMSHPTLSRWWSLVGDTAPEPTDAEAEGALQVASAFPMTPMQLAYWTGSESGPRGAVSAKYYVEFGDCRVSIQSLELALRRLIARHPMLRAVFRKDGYQEIQAGKVSPIVRLHDLVGASSEGLSERQTRLREEIVARSMPEADGAPLITADVSRWSGGASRLHLCICMIVVDALSFKILLEDFAALCGGSDGSLPRLRITFQQYLQRDIRQAEARRRDAEYWKNRIAALAALPMLPLVHDLRQRVRLGHRSHRVDVHTRQRLTSIAHAYGLTLSSLFMAAFAEVVGRWSESKAFLLAIPIVRRTLLHADVARIVGDFTDVVLLEVDCGTTEAVYERGLRVQKALAEALSHCEYSGVEVARELARRRADWDVAPIVFTSTIGLGDLFGEDVTRVFGDPEWLASQTPRVWLDCQLIEGRGDILVHWDILEGRFQSGVADAMFDAFIAILTELADATVPFDVRIPAAQRLARFSWERSEGFRTDLLLHTDFFAHAARHPQDTALAYGVGHRVTYGVLAGDALRVAGGLRQAGISPGDVVGVCMESGAPRIAAVLGILAAGAAYLPISWSQPANRKAAILGTAEVRAVVTDQRAASTDFPPDVRALRLAELLSRTALAAPTSVDPASLAYVMFTSGSSGQPKGVEITHSAALNTIQDVVARFDVGASDLILAVSALEFDLSVFDIFGLLAVGGTVVLVEDDFKTDPGHWLTLLDRWNVTVWNSVPAVFEMLLIAAESRGAHLSLRVVLNSGDWVSASLESRFRSLSKEAGRFIALGGATEAAIWSNYYEVQAGGTPPWQFVPYGYPLTNQRFRVVDECGNDCPDWVAGELWIGGASVALGYRRDPSLSAMKFPIINGERWYRTGDRGRYWPDGSLEFLGRQDLQVKINGYRIELGEVEAAVLAHPNVENAVAYICPQGRRRIVVALSTRRDLRVEDIGGFVAERLPAYMCPSQFQFLDQLPLTANGKVDRSALSASLVDETPPPEDIVGLQPTETAISGIWRSQLSLPAVPRNSHFLELGGDSLTAVRVIEAINARFGVRLSMREFLENPSVARLSAWVEGNRGELVEGVL